MARAAGGGGHYAIPIADPPVQNQPDTEIERRFNLYLAAWKGDWKSAERILLVHKDEINAELTVRKETALHVATLAEKTEFVRELVRKMNKHDLACADVEKRTALSLAALTGKVELAQVIMDKNPDLATMRTIEGILPIHIAAFSGHRKMVKYLHPRTIINDEDYRDLLVGLVNSDMFDIALDVLPKDRKDLYDLLTQKDTYGETFLSAVARKPQMLSKSGLFSCLCSKAVQNFARRLLMRIWKKLAIMEEAKIKAVVGDGWKTIFVAVENGNVEFLRIIIDCYPDLVTKTNDKGQTIFHVAILNRQKEIFRLIHNIGSMKMLISTSIDVDGNHMLHLAAQLPPSNRLQSITGEALQLRQEILWYQEVEAVVGSRLAKENRVLPIVSQTQIPYSGMNQWGILMSNQPKTPREIFIKKHENMICKGQDHVKKTAESCIVVAILVTTLVFAAAYTVAGGPDQSTGYPIFLHDNSFKIFAVADALSLIFSVASLLTFLTILTSSNALDEFVWWIPTKLMIGFLTLFVSIISMMVAFVTVFFVYFKQHHLYLKYGVPVAVVSSLPPLLFLLLPGRIFLRMKLKSTLFTPH